MSDPTLKPWCAVERNYALGKLRIVAGDVDARLTQALGFAAPDAGRHTGDATLACLRAGPHEWLVLGSVSAVTAALARIGDAFREDLALILDMSHGALLLRLSGHQAIERIAAYCDLDLHPQAFATGHATRTRFGDVAVTIARTDDQPGFWLIADQSHSDYLMRLLDHGVAAG